MTTYLNVPFREKAEAKSKGARWDNEVRKWFVPIGHDLAPFTNWLPSDPASAAAPASTSDLTVASQGIPLSTLLAGVAAAVDQVFKSGVWTTAEVAFGTDATVVCTTAANSELAVVASTLKAPGLFATTATAAVAMVTAFSTIS